MLRTILPSLLIFYVLSPVFANAEAGANQRVVHYDPSITEISGILERQTFPGPPNYESIQNGDDMERGWYLMLDHSIDVVALAIPNSNDESERNVKVMQIVVMNDDHEKVLRSTPSGAQLTIRGTLFHRLTGHHHSRVLVEV